MSPDANRPATPPAPKQKLFLKRNLSKSGDNSLNNTVIMSDTLDFGDISAKDYNQKRKYAPNTSYYFIHTSKQTNESTKAKQEKTDGNSAWACLIGFCVLYIYVVSISLLYIFW